MELMLLQLGISEIFVCGNEDYVVVILYCHDGHGQ